MCVCICLALFLGSILHFMRKYILQNISDRFTTVAPLLHPQGLIILSDAYILEKLSIYIFWWRTNSNVYDAVIFLCLFCVCGSDKFG